MGLLRVSEKLHDAPFAFDGLVRERLKLVDNSERCVLVLTGKARIANDIGKPNSG